MENNKQLAKIKETDAVKVRDEYKMENLLEWKDLSEAQKWEVERAIENGVLSNVRSMIADKFKHFQMRQIRLGYEHGLSSSQVAAYQDGKISGINMEVLRIAQEENYPELIKIYKEYSGNGQSWNVNQLWQGLKAFRSGISLSDIKKFFNPDYSADKIRELRIAAYNDVDIEELLKLQSSGEIRARVEKILETEKKELKDDTQAKPAKEDLGDMREEKQKEKIPALTVMLTIISIGLALVCGYLLGKIMR